MRNPFPPSQNITESEKILTSSRIILEILFRSFMPGRIIDVGCGAGHWLRTAQELGVTHITGIGATDIKSQALLIEPAVVIPADLETTRVKDIPSLEAPPFDLVISLETAGNLSPDRAVSFIHDLTGLGDAVLFSAPAPLQNGSSYRNPQWPGYWAKLFHENGFDCLDIIRPFVWRRKDVAWQHAQNTLLFVRRGSMQAAHWPLPVTASTAPQAIVHPVNYLSQISNSSRYDFFMNLTLEQSYQHYFELRLLRAELERQLTEIQTVVRQAASNMRKQIFDWENSRGVRLMNCYYQLYSQPILGPFLKIMRRGVKYCVRQIRRARKNMSM